MLKASKPDVIRVGGVRANARWWREFLGYDPAPDYARIAAPVLAITGGHDMQVPPDDVAAIGHLVQGPFDGHLRWRRRAEFVQEGRARARIVHVDRLALSHPPGADDRGAERVSAKAQELDPIEESHCRRGIGLALVASVEPAGSWTVRSYGFPGKI